MGARENNAVALTAQREPALVLRGLIRTARPRQWIKNVLVFAAPAAANALGRGPVLRSTLVVFVIFCLAASSVYLFNDALDVIADRAHPTKRRRPIAAGVVSIRLAYSVALVLAVLAFAGSAVLLNWRTLVLIALYLVTNIAYCLRLKHVVLVDVVIVASGFVIRAAVGALASGLVLSQWFLLTATFGALFVAVGKRASDIVLVGQDAGKTRSALEDYPPEFLRFMLVFAAAGAAMSYGLWSFAVLKPTSDFPWAFSSVVAFVFLLLRYALLVELGRGGEPEKVILGDRTAQLVSVLFVVAFVGAVLQW